MVSERSSSVVSGDEREGTADGVVYPHHESTEEGLVKQKC